MTNAELKAEARNMLRPQFSTVLLTLLVFGLLIGLLNIIPIIGPIAVIVLAGPLSVGAMIVYTNVTHGQQAQLEQIFEPVKTNLLTCFLANLVSGISIALWSILFLIPGIMKAYSYAMVPYVLRYEPELSAMDALGRSEQLMRGHRKELFMLHLSFIGWLLLVIFTVGLALLWVAPFMQIATTMFFDSIYTPSPESSVE